MIDKNISENSTSIDRAVHIGEKNHDVTMMLTAPNDKNSFEKWKTIEVT